MLFLLMTLKVMNGQDWSHIQLRLQITPVVLGPDPDHPPITNDREFARRNPSTDRLLRRIHPRGYLLHGHQGLGHIVTLGHLSPLRVVSDRRDGRNRQASRAPPAALACAPGPAARRRPLVQRSRARRPSHCEGPGLDWVAFASPNPLLLSKNDRIAVSSRRNGWSRFWEAVLVRNERRFGGLRGKRALIRGFFPGYSRQASSASDSAKTSKAPRRMARFLD